MAGIFCLDASVSAAPVAPSPAPSAAASANVVRETLANGLKVVLLPDRLAPVATLSLAYAVGSNDDTMPGVAHATEHMLFRGTKDVSAGQYADITARAGSQYDAQTTNIFTQFYGSFPSSYLGLMIRLEADRMNGATITDAAWATERGAIEQEIRGHDSVPLYTEIGKLRAAVYAGTPYVTDAGGTIAGFEKMKASDIRAFYATWYHPNDATLVIAGDIDPVQTLAQIHAAFDPIPSVPVPPHPLISPAPLVTTTIDAGVADLPIPIAGVAYRFPHIGEADYPATEVLIAALDSGRGGLADLAATGKVLIADAESSAYREVGEGEIFAAGMPGAKPADVLKSVQGVIDGYIGSGIPDDLIAAAKTRLLAGQAYRQASIAGLAGVWTGALMFGRNSPDEVYDGIAGVTPADVNRVLKTYVKNGLSILLAPKASASFSRPVANAGAENVKYHTDKVETLPDWTLAYFRAPLRAPDESIAPSHKLKNGLYFTARRVSMSPVVYVTGEIQTADELNEPLGKDGVSGITDGLLDYGTVTYDRKAYQAQTDTIAANISLGTSFSLRIPAANFDEGMRLLADGLLHPALPQSGLDVLRAQTAQSLAASAALPSTRAAIAETDALYPPGDPRRRHETPASVMSISMNDVKRWYRFTYRPELTAIAIAGDVDPAKAAEIVKKYFGTWKPGRGIEPSFDYPTLSARTGKSVKVTSQTDAQSSVTLTQVLAVHNDKPADRIALQLANTMLSGTGVGSLLFRDVRTAKGYVYGIDSSMSIGRTQSTFSISFSADPKNARKAQAEAVAVVQQLQAADVPLETLQSAKAVLLAEQVLPLASYSGVAGDMLEDLEIGYSQKQSTTYWNALLNTTPAQIRAAMRKWIDTKRFTRVEVAPGS